MLALDTGVENGRSSQCSTQACRINDLPYDVFYLLLVMCWDDTQGYRGGKEDHFPVIASHVCRIWRQHAINTPSFWAKLTFQSKIPQLEKYQVWLARLKDAPFDVHIGWQPFTSASIKHAKGIMRLIMPHISHIRSLRVNNVPTKILRLIFDRLRDANAPLLRTLRVDMPSGRARLNPNPPGKKKWELKPFHRGQMPNLRKLQLDGTPHGYITERFGETLSAFKITPGVRVETPHGHAKFIQEILLRAPNLRGLGYHAVGLYYPDTAHEERQTFHNPLLPPVTHSSLEALCIEGNRKDTDVIICSLRLPQARCLADGYGGELLLGLCCLQTIGLGSFPKLVSLHLGGSRRPYRRPQARDPLNSQNLTHLLHALQAVPELRALTFQHVDFEDGKYLLKCLGSAGCCPKLEWLTLLQCGGYTMRELREVVEARQQLNGVRPLTRLAAHGWPIDDYSSREEHEEARNWLRRMVDLRLKSHCTDEERANYLRSVEGLDLDVFE
ncbi:hypothetical protein FS837_005139 [Tulasnella sp. UAMH 9824]|nr:hypothetical protein FS837_005139 [Tulasnella sp. UAMH 9824]